jgi:hypothetical protein
MTSERIKQIQETTAYPESVSVKQALLQVWNECSQERNYSKEEVLDLLYKRDLYVFNRDESIDLELPEEWVNNLKLRYEQ